MKRGATGLEVLVGLAIVGGLLFMLAPGVFHGASRRAKASTQATAKLEEATTNRDATAAASVTAIGTANTQAPESPAKSFISREVPVALSLLPPPDPIALLDAEKRRVAVMEGRLAEANRLYEQVAQKAERLQQERDRALAERHAADVALEKAAAAEHARTLQVAGLGAIALLIGGAYLYLKFTGISPSTIGAALVDIQNGATPVQAFDGLLSVAQQRRVAKARKLASP